jgi:hypothetical protein
MESRVAIYDVPRVAAGHRGSGDGDSGTSVGDRVLTQLLNELDVCAGSLYSCLDSTGCVPGAAIGQGKSLLIRLVAPIPAGCRSAQERHRIGCHKQTRRDWCAAVPWMNA